MKLDAAAVKAVNLLPEPNEGEESCELLLREDGWLVGCVLRPIDSVVIWRRHPHLLSLAKDMKLGFYTFRTGNRTLGRRMAVHYTTTAPRQLH